MCGIAGAIELSEKPVPHLDRRLAAMSTLLKHRGPDDEGTWTHSRGHVGLAHRRLSIIDLVTGQQPMVSEAGNVIVFNGEIYNYLELKRALPGHAFKTTSDTEVILAAYEKWGADCVDHLRGMFAFAIWDESRRQLFCARDRFGIKPFYFTQVGNVLYFASEAKGLLPFLDAIETDVDALKDYLVFQFCLDGKTLFRNVTELKPAHRMTIRNGVTRVEKYWEVYYEPDFCHELRYFSDHVAGLINDSVRFHLRSDVPVGAYVSGGADSSIVASVASRLQSNAEFKAFTGRFDRGELYDETPYARALVEHCGMTPHEITITSQDFVDSIRQVIYHLDFPVAGPGSFAQFHVSKLASAHRKVVLGGQGGDEIFGGYARYLIAYFEQCIKGAIDGTMHNGNFIVTYESIIPNLTALQNYKPLLKYFWRDGLFEDLDRRYFRLINRADTLRDEVNWNRLGDYEPFEVFRQIFRGSNVGKESYLDRMTHFDFKTLLPALLHVEDRMSMAHGLESRVPFLDHPIVEFAATMPSDVKFKAGTLKMVLVNAMRNDLPAVIAERKNKMGFPVPLVEWIRGELNEFVVDVFNTQAAKKRDLFNTDAILSGLSEEQLFGRKIWGLLSLELWHQEFHDRAAHYRSMIPQA